MEAMRLLSIYCIAILFLHLQYCTTTVTQAQAPAAAPAKPGGKTTIAAPATAPGGQLDVTRVLTKARQFTTLIRLLKLTQVSNNINTQLDNSDTGMTLFAPTDNAFAALPAGTLNSLTDQQKVDLMQFHVLPSLVKLSQFQTISNPVRTQAGDNNGQFPLNVTSDGKQVNVTTGLTNTTVTNTIYSDKKLAVYEVDQVLLPLEIFRPSTPAPTPAPTPSKSGKDGSSSSPDAPNGSSKDSSSDDSGAGGLENKAFKWIVVIAATASFFWWTV